MARAPKNPGYVAFGSAEHAALLGISSIGPNSEQRKQELETQLNTVPIVVSKKRPITREEYAASNRGNQGDEIIDGWTRQGR
jgi:hypothetical protein